MRQLLMLPLCALILGLNARMKLSGDLRQLGESAIRRLIHPIIIDTEKKVLDGSRRVLGMRTVLGETSDRPVECLMTDEEMTPAKILEINVVTAMHREGLTGHEQFLACTSMLHAHPEWQAKDLATALNISQPNVTRILSPGKCLPAWREALEAGRVTISDCYAASQLSDVEQHALLCKKLGDGTAPPKERGARNGFDKPSKIRIPFQGGEVVVMGLDMAGVVAGLEGLLKEARKALGSVEVKTFAAIQRDKCK